MFPTLFSALKNPQRSPEATPPVFFRLGPRWITFLSILTLLKKTRSVVFSRVLFSTYSSSTPRRARSLQPSSGRGASRRAWGGRV
jgi:hypothetical protein